MEEGGRVDVELPVNWKVLWDRGADKIQLNKPNRPESWSSGAPLNLAFTHVDQYTHHSVTLLIEKRAHLMSEHHILFFCSVIVHSNRI